MRRKHVVDQNPTARIGVLLLLSHQFSFSGSGLPPYPESSPPFMLNPETLNTWSLIPPTTKPKPLNPEALSPTLRPTFRTTLTSQVTRKPGPLKLRALQHANCLRLNLWRIWLWGGCLASVCVHRVSRTSANGCFCLVQGEGSVTVP